MSCGPLLPRTVRLEVRGPGGLRLLAPAAAASLCAALETGTSVPVSTG